MSTNMTTKLPATTTPATFEILDRGITIVPAAPEQRAVVGDVARLSDGRLLARSTEEKFAFCSATGRRRRDGELHTYWSFDFDPKVPRRVIATGPPDLAPGMAATMERLAARSPLGIVGATAEDAEFAEFTGKYPRIAALLKIPSGREPPLRSRHGTMPGVVSSPDRRCGVSPEWASALVSHISGDYGRIGRHDPTPLTQEEKWLLGLLPRARLNDAAIESGNGSVTSEFVLPNDLQQQLDSGRRIGSDSRWCIHAWTIITPGGSRSLLHVALEEAA